MARRIRPQVTTAGLESQIIFNTGGIFFKAWSREPKPDESSGLRGRPLRAWLSYRQDWLYAAGTQDAVRNLPDGSYQTRMETTTPCGVDTIAAGQTRQYWQVRTSERVRFRARSQTQGGGTGKNGGGDEAKRPRDSGHGAGFQFQEELPRGKLREARCAMKTFTEIPPPKTVRAIRMSASGGPKLYQRYSYTYGVPVPSGHRKFGM